MNRTLNAPTRRRSSAADATPASPPAPRPARAAGPAAPIVEPAPRAVEFDRPSPEAIAERAYLIYERRCRIGASGDSTTDWLEAEAELVRERSRAELLLSDDGE